MDLRTQKTLQFIEKAFVEQVLLKGFSKVTISDLAEQAKINRKTFYAHYLDKYDLAEKLGDKLIAKYDHSLTERLSGKNTDLNDIIDGFISNNEDLQLFKAMLTVHSDEYDFEVSFIHFLKKRCAEDLMVDDPLEKELLANYAITSIKYYLRKDEPLSVKRQYAFIQKLASLIGKPE